MERHQDNFVFYYGASSTTIHPNNELTCDIIQSPISNHHIYLSFQVWLRSFMLLWHIYSLCAKLGIENIFLSPGVSM